MCKIHKSLAKTNENHQRTLMTSDDIYKRVALFLSEIRSTILQWMEPKRFKIAYGLIKRLQHLTYVYPSSYRERDSDPISDDLLIESAN